MSSPAEPRPREETGPQEAEGGHPARGLASAAAGAAYQLSSRVSAACALGSLTDDDIAAVLPDISQAGLMLAACVKALAVPPVTAAARDAAGAGPARAAAAAEAAWELGAGHGRTGATPFDPDAAARGDAGDYLSIVVLAGQRAVAEAVGLAGDPDDPALAAAVAAYCEGYGEAAGLPDDGPPAADGLYAEGREVVTALGRAGILTGAAGRGGNPRVAFGGGPPVTVPRAAVTVPAAAGAVAWLPGPVQPAPARAAPPGRRGAGAGGETAVRAGRHRRAAR